MQRDRLYGAGRTLIGLYSRLMLDLDVQWTAELPSGPKIVAINHPTTSDPFVILPVFPEPVRVLIIASCFGLPLFGEYLRAAGHIPVLVKDGRAALDEARRRLDNGETVGIFPEGVLSPAVGLGRPRTGAARLAIATGAPVLPVGVALLRERAVVVPTTITPTGASGVAKWYLRGPYAITVGAPVTYAGDAADRERVVAVSADIMRRIDDLARESDLRVQLSATAGGRPGLRAVLGGMVNVAWRLVSVVR
jgi:1-acyl-sn-glycerol-3-phosphate acyltransferase